MELLSEEFINLSASEIAYFSFAFPLFNLSVYYSFFIFNELLVYDFENNIITLICFLGCISLKIHIYF